MAPSGDPPFRQIIRDRMLVEMLRGIKSSGGEWKVLITDAFTLRVISASCKMPQVTEEGISLIEDINKRRQPLPAMEAVYFIQPTTESIGKFVKDMGAEKPLYKRAHVFFSRPVSRENLQLIKDNQRVRARIAGLKELNLEVLTVDVQGFITEHENAVVTLFQENIRTQDYELVIDEVATRLATVFASLKELPAVRYRAAKATGTAVSPQRMRELVPSKVAASLWAKLSKYKDSVPGFPRTDTCDLLIVDRSVDVVTPIIHDWSYGGMCFDLLPMDGNKYEREVETYQGRQKETVFLDEHDPMWVELRDMFLQEAFVTVQKYFNDVTSNSGSLGDMSGKQMHALVKNLPKLQEQKAKVGLHFNIATMLGKQIPDQGLYEVGTLEQGFVFGDSAATYKELAALINKYPDLSVENKMRLLMVYAAMNPEKLDPQKQMFWMKLAKLDERHMRTVINLEFLGVGINKETKSSFGLTFGSRKDKGKVRKERDSEYQLSRFFPQLQDILEDLNESKLSTQDYPYVQEPHSAPSASVRGSARGGGGGDGMASGFSSLGLGGSDKSSAPAASARAAPEKPAASARAAVSASGSSLASWALKGAGGGEADVGSASGGSSARGASGRAGGGGGEKGRRLFVFIVGGMVRSELRVAHTLSKELNRDVIIGSTALYTPLAFIEQLKLLKQ
eukprot:TRINITY_DN3892_c0_g1_i1.p1 TRINITY_DN3892_c0_g1~~TRINITY_DN3892_c0_g1_i1.p1  ORF type:complete len:678 (+),score=65.01 TRINITY_DN3892_c0_g1_i1:64-2097(+)